MRLWLAVLVGLLFAGALFWAKSRDPFERIWFMVKAPGHGKAKCLAVLPKMAARPLPVVIYLHGSGGSLPGSGNELRQLAELGLAAVGIEYNQTNELAFEAELLALNGYLQRQKWADLNAVAWVGFSLGANKSLAFALKHPEARPGLLIQISVGWIPALGAAEAGIPRPDSTHGTSKPTRSTVLLIHAEEDEIFSPAEVRRVAAALATNGFPVELKMIPGQSHGFEPNRPVLFRAVGEYCLAHLKGAGALQNHESILSWQGRVKPLWWFWFPELLWAVVWPYTAWKRSRLERGTEQPKLNHWEVGLRWLAGILALLAAVQITVHLLIPRSPVTPFTLAVARRLLVEPKEISDFDYLVTNGFGQDKALRTLLEHVKLANYSRELVNWKLDDDTYRRYVLSPQVDEMRDGDTPWRRALWESFYPRVRRETDVISAAQSVVRFLRERVGINPRFSDRASVGAIWTRGMADEAGFERVYVAALRSVGIAARLNDAKQAELFSDGKWQIAPRPLITSW